MKWDITVFAGSHCSALLSVEVILPRFTGNKLTFLGTLEALGIRLIRFHRHIKLYILPILA
ncbi:MAG: hypothetical protein AAB719_02535 [Patescibacteria group bacterium]